MTMHYNHIGTDIVEIVRIERVIQRWGNSFLQRVFTERELKLYLKKTPSLAARFSGKEAVMKVLGTGRNGVNWREIEIIAEPDGKPLVYLHGRAQRHAHSLGLGKIAISLSHSREYALAFAIGETAD